MVGKEFRLDVGDKGLEKSRNLTESSVVGRLIKQWATGEPEVGDD